MPTRYAAPALVDFGAALLARAGLDDSKARVVAEKVDDQNRMTSDQYGAKIQNLASLVKGYQVVALQETGGRTEITGLANSARMSWLWTAGNPRSNSPSPRPNAAIGGTFSSAK